MATASTTGGYYSPGSSMGGTGYTGTDSHDSSPGSYHYGSSSGGSTCYVGGSGSSGSKTTGPKNPVSSNTVTSAEATPEMNTPSNTANANTANVNATSEGVDSSASYSEQEVNSDHVTTSEAEEAKGSGATDFSWVTLDSGKSGKNKTNDDNSSAKGGSLTLTEAMGKTETTGDSSAKADSKAGDSYGWVTDTGNNAASKFAAAAEGKTNSWDQMALDAREQAGKNERTMRNWTYNGDWRKGKDSVTNVEHNANLAEMDRAWNEANESIGKWAEATKAAEAARAAENFRIGEDVSNKEFTPDQSLYELSDEYLTEMLAGLPTKMGGVFGDKEVVDWAKAYRQLDVSRLPAEEDLVSYLQEHPDFEDSQEGLLAYNMLMKSVAARVTKNVPSDIFDYDAFMNYNDPRLSDEYGTIRDQIEKVASFDETRNGEGAFATNVLQKSLQAFVSDQQSVLSKEFSQEMKAVLNEAGIDEKTANQLLTSYRSRYINDIARSLRPYRDMAKVVSAYNAMTRLAPAVEAMEPEKAEELKETVWKETEENFAKELKNFKDYSDKINAVSVDASNYETASRELNEISNNLSEFANKTYQQMVESMLESGSKLQDIADSPDLKQFSNDLFTVAQQLYDKVSEIEETSGKYGLNDLSKKTIKNNIDTISENIAYLAGNVGKEGSALGTYYSPGSDMNGEGIGGTGVNITKDQVKALAAYGDHIESTKDAAIALMKSAAFNGAENVKGGKWSEAWKSEMAGEKLNAKDFIAASLKGTLGVTVAMLGAGIMAANPVLGTLLLSSGIKTAAETGMGMALKGTRAYSTNAETLFGAGDDYTGKNIMNDVYNRSYEKANIGDPKSVGTYTTAVGASMNMLVGLMSLTDAAVSLATGNPVGVVIGAVELLATAKESDAVRDSVTTLMNGGLRGATNNLVSNVYALANNIVEWSDMNISVSDYMRDPNNRDVITNANNMSTGASRNTPVTVGEGSKVDDTYGLESSGGDADAKYSGAVESAKNSNLALDYNAGMEQAVNEAVSDERVKGYIVSVYGKEPDWIRRAIDKVLKMHSESEW